MKAVCACCDANVVSKCGSKNIWHWAHKSKRMCDVWWENETKWHRDWKGVFPIENQEIVHKAEDGEKHIADVKTTHGCIIEFQHSYIKKAERDSRNDFYKKIVWVVDGQRRLRDKGQFNNALEMGCKLLNSPLLFEVFTEDSRLIKEWGDSEVPVFFDFGEEERIWWLLPFKNDVSSYVVPLSRKEFIRLHLGEMEKTFLDFINECLDRYRQYFDQRKSRSQRRYSIPLPNWGRGIIRRGRL
jgi:competence protein CoiA